MGFVAIPAFAYANNSRLLREVEDTGALSLWDAEAAALASCEVDTFPMTPEGLAELAREGQDGSNPDGTGKPNNPAEITRVTKG